MKRLISVPADDDDRLMIYPNIDERNRVEVAIRVASAAVTAVTADDATELKVDDN